VDGVGEAAVGAGGAGAGGFFSGTSAGFSPVFGGSDSSFWKMERMCGVGSKKKKKNVSLRKSRRNW
jgi:hypothetical protein